MIDSKTLLRECSPAPQLFGCLAQERPYCQGRFVLGKPSDKALADSGFKIGPPLFVPQVG